MASSESSSNKGGQKSATNIHPFFMPLSAKRAHSAATTPALKDSSAPQKPTDENQPKRQRQKASGVLPAPAKQRSKPKAQTQLQLGPSSLKAAKTQSFLAAKPERSNAQNSSSPAIQIVESDNTSTPPTHSGISGFVSINSEADNKRLKRMAARAAGMPAPFPKDFTHVPAPQYTSFTSLRYNNSSVQTHDASWTHAPKDISTSSQDGGCAQWRSLVGIQQAQEPLDTATKTSPVCVSLGTRLSKPPPSHMYYAEPLLHMLRKRVHTTPARNMQLLPSRYHPRRACEILGNRRVVSLLHSWIEGMRLKHSVLSSSSAKHAGDNSSPSPCADLDAGSGHACLMPKKSGRRQPRRRIVHGDDANGEGEGYPEQFAQESGYGSSSSSSDDFVPTPTPRTRRGRASEDKEMEGIYAWARSNGTLNSVREHLRVSSRRKGRSRSSGSESESETFSNIILLEGPSGSGKTAAVYACAEESGFQVHEIHPGQRRSGKDILAALEDLILSHTIASTSTLTPTSAAFHSRRRTHNIDAKPCASRAACGRGDSLVREADLEFACQLHPHASKSRPANAAEKHNNRASAVQGVPQINQLLILIDQIDVLFEQDQRLWPALKQLALKSRRPIVLTCTDMSCIRWDAVRFHSVLHFQRPSEHLLVPYCFLLCLAEGVLVSPADLACLCKETDCDINRMLCSLELVIRQANMSLVAATTTTTTTSSSSSAAATKSASPGSTGFYDMPVAEPSLVSSMQHSLCYELDLDGTLAWLLNPLEPGETPETRYNFWYELVTSAQPRGSKSWYKLWPDLPPFETAEREPDSKVAVPKAEQNSYFAQSSYNESEGNGATTGTAALPNQQQQQQSENGPSCRAVVPVSLTRHPEAQDSNSSSSSDLDPASDLTRLECLAASFDLMSLASTTVYPSQAETECMREPLHSHLNPMVDGCLDISYAVLDPDVLTRRNTPMLPDGIGSAQDTRSNIYEYMCAATARQTTACSSGFLAEALDSIMCLQNVVVPSLASNTATRRTDTLAALYRALDFADVWQQRRPALAIQETASYLALMIMWDCIHQGKMEPPTGSVPMSAGEQHLHRGGTRRTRMNTYRAHIKRMPASMQEFLLSWLKMG